jgi:hypothetical protein
MITQCVHVCENTLLAYFRADQEGGIEALKLVASKTTRSGVSILTYQPA